MDSLEHCSDGGCDRGCGHINRLAPGLVVDCGPSIGTEARWLLISVVAITLRGDGSIRRSTESWSTPTWVLSRRIMACGPSVDTGHDRYELTSIGTRHDCHALTSWPSPSVVIGRSADSQR